MEKPEIREVPEVEWGGASLILQERARQIAKGYTPTHDDTHDDRSLAEAARMMTDAAIMEYEPYDVDRTEIPAWVADFVQKALGKYADPVRRLTIAGALIAAEIDRLLRKEKQALREQEEPS